MEGQLQELARQVQLLQCGSPAEVRAASKTLADFQRSRGALRLALPLLTSTPFACAFAAQSLAQRARIGAPEDAAEWPEVAQKILELLCTEHQTNLPRLAQRQLCVALSRCFVALGDEWPEAVPTALQKLGTLEQLTPLLEFLQALAEEPFSRRLLVDGSLRSRFLLALRRREAAIFAALNEALQRQPSVATLDSAAAWLRAQGLYEEWLPMIGVGAAYTDLHPSLVALAPALQNQVPQLLCDPSALASATQLWEAALPLATHTDAERILAPILITLQELISLRRGDEEALGALLTAFHAAVTQPSVVTTTATLRAMTIDMGMKLMIATGPRSGLEVDLEGGLLGRCFDAWEGMATCEHCTLMEEQAFHALLEVIPQALMLPEDLRSTAITASSATVRGRMAQLLTVWCGQEPHSQQRLHQVIQRLDHFFSNAVAGPTPSLPYLELLLAFASAVAEAVATASSTEEGNMPVELQRVLSLVPKTLTIGACSGTWSVALEASAAELVSSLDPWITVDNFDGKNMETLLHTVFALAASPHATSPSVEALCVVLSNLAPKVAAKMPLAETCFGALKELILGDAHRLGESSRERLAKSALGPLLSHFEESLQQRALDAILEPLRQAAPPQYDGAARCQAQWRLLFALLAAPEPQRSEVSLTWLSQHWAWCEVAIRSSDSACEGAVIFLETVLTRTRSKAASQEVVQRLVPMLVEVVCHRGSVACLSTFAAVTRIFKGGDEVTAPLLAQQVLHVAEQLLSKLQRTQDLTPDLFAALLELFVVSWAPKSARLAPQVLQATTPCAAVLHTAAQLLEVAVNPRLTCWALLLLGRLPIWLQKPETQGYVRTLLELTLPSFCTAFRGLLGQPVAMDAEVASTMAEVLLSLNKAVGPSFTGTLGNALGGGSLDAPGTLLVMQLNDPLVSEDALAESLRDVAEQLQAQELRQLLE